MKLIILHDPLKLDFCENLPGLYGTSILYKKPKGHKEPKLLKNTYVEDLKIL